IALFSTEPATPELYTPSLRDALPISNLVVVRFAVGVPLARQHLRRRPLPQVVVARKPGSLHQVRGLRPEGVVGLQFQHRVRQPRSEEHTSELQSRENLVCRLLLEKKK